MRKIKATLRKPGNNLGYVKVAVHTYAYLLTRSADDTSSYGPSFFAKELLAGQDAVVRVCVCVGGGACLVRASDDDAAEGCGGPLARVCPLHLSCTTRQIPLLLRDIHIEMRTLGAELLSVFTSVQSPADTKLDAIQAHTPQVRVWLSGCAAMSQHTCMQGARPLRPAASITSSACCRWLRAGVPRGAGRARGGPQGAAAAGDG
jgi:hypothetical protein